MLPGSRDTSHADHAVLYWVPLMASLGLRSCPVAAACPQSGQAPQLTTNQATLLFAVTALLRWMVNELAETFGTAERT